MTPEERNKNTSSSDNGQDLAGYAVRIAPNTDLNEAWEQMQQREGQNTSTQLDESARRYAAMAEHLRIRPDEEIAAPPVCLTIGHENQLSTVGTLGNFSVLIGKAKSRKTFTVSFATAAALQCDTQLNRITGSLPDDKRTILFFDTEQSRHHVLKLVKRICQLAQQPVPPNLLVFSLRDLSAEDCLGFIEYAIYATPNVGIAVIDGIRDTVKDINDNAEATERSRDLLRWSAQLDIHILTVIHVNKSNDSIRGALGTELQNKAETVFSVSLDPNDKSASIVRPEYCRDKDFEPFAFSVDEYGLPYLREDWQADTPPPSRKGATSNPQKKTPANTPGQFTTEQHEVILRRAFTDKPPGKYADTCYRIKQAAEYFGHKFGDNRAKEFVTYYTDKGLLLKDKQTYTLNLAPAEPEELSV
jgi:hypothetical protein